MPPEECQPVKEQLALSQNPDEVAIKTINADLIAGYTLLRDISNKPALLMKVTLERRIYKQGQRALQLLLVSLLLVGVIFSVAIILLLEKVILSRLIGLSSDVKQIGTANDLSLRVKVLSKDELSTLAITINSMLDTIEEASLQLVEEQKKRKICY
ncbi:MAG: HAMP domain-containing protein [Synechococcaceae cyanobacterium RL_1_2]|nr:HAMP domain-containing protein [Synechococcaceae cyanobacterium RL_1_2]